MKDIVGLDIARRWTCSASNLSGCYRAPSVSI